MIQPRLHIALIGLLMAMTGNPRIRSDAEGSSGAATQYPAAKTYFVARNNAEASDDNPGTASLPWKTISRSTSPGTLLPGDTVIIREGIYRESIRPVRGGADEHSRITFQSFPGEEVEVTGADIVRTGWTVEDSLWILPGYRSFRSHGDSTFQRTLVVVDGEVLNPTYRREALRPGTFMLESTKRRRTRLFLYPPGQTGSNPEDHVIEIGRRDVLFGPVNPSDPGLDCGDARMPGWFSVSGIKFSHAANRAQQGAVCTGSVGTLLSGITVEWTNGLGIDASGKRHELLENRSLSNGQAGIGGSCSYCLIEGNRSSYNNWKGHNILWEAGGGKWYRTDHTLVTDHEAIGNHGPGIWLDGDNDTNTIEYSLFEKNELAGVFLELNTVNTVVRNNRIRKTKRHKWAGAGILIQAASSNNIEGNSITGNDGAGIWLRGDRRAYGGKNTIRGNTVQNNVHVPGNDFSEIAVTADSLSEIRSNRFVDNTVLRIRDREVDLFYIRARDVDLRYRGSDPSVWRSLVDGSNADPSSPREMPGGKSVETRTGGR